jgi:hypothetical protein
MNNEKTYSFEDMGWTKDFGILLGWLMDYHHTDNPEDLIGEKYLVADSVPVDTRDLVDVELIADTIRQQAIDILDFECVEDWPVLTEEEKTEFENMIVEFLDKKDPSGFYLAKNIEEKTIAADDLKEATK